ncbi:hypothetical protein J3R30DRAFT_231883 [Lentinula aciculospora]|uniref:Uncharacterized protein n=1 Tax=Lentinula aciculospora TaxID=153920 RepID=A0A9W9A9B7_9AGAR|nr:hypothetical protein J3R30DRAFT_231883 [Lentinula aciculospora]
MSIVGRKSTLALLSTSIICMNSLSQYSFSIDEALLAITGGYTTNSRIGDKAFLRLIFVLVHNTTMLPTLHMPRQQNSPSPLLLCTIDYADLHHRNLHINKQGCSGLPLRPINIEFLNPPPTTTRPTKYYGTKSRSIAAALTLNESITLSSQYG